MQKFDIVYVLKKDLINQELIYSLRSVEANFPHNKICFAGGQPIELIPDIRINVKQKGDTKWSRVRNLIVDVCENKNVSDDFWLFNDDFFILKPVNKIYNYYNGTLKSHIDEIERRHYGNSSSYTVKLRECEKALNEKKYTTLNYAIHLPILINKEKALKTIEAFPECPMFRSLYGNMYSIGGEEHEDVKIVDMNAPIPEGADFVSTEDCSFAYGAVGAQLKKIFSKSSKYENVKK